jgi:hypothetical protein
MIRIQLKKRLIENGTEHEIGSQLVVTHSRFEELHRDGYVGMHWSVGDPGGGTTTGMHWS